MPPSKIMTWRRRVSRNSEFIGLDRLAERRLTSPVAPRVLSFLTWRLGKRRDSLVIRRLDLIRHAHAQPSSPDGDAGRELSPEGVAAARNLGRNLCVTGWRPDVVLTSPLTRAHQTAQLLVDEQEGPIRIEILEELVAEEEPAAAWAAIQSAARDRRHVVVVGHQPLVGLLIEKMTGQSVAVPPGALHAIELADESGSGQIVARG